MYACTVRNIFNIATQFKTPKRLSSVGLIFPVLTLSTVQKIIPGTVTFFTHHFCSKPENLYPKEGMERKEYIEKEAEREVQKLMEENPELKKIKDIYELEINVMRQDGQRVPSYLRPRDWAELLKLRSSKARKYTN